MFQTSSLVARWATIIKYPPHTIRFPTSIIDRSPINNDNNNNLIVPILDHDFKLKISRGELYKRSPRTKENRPVIRDKSPSGRYNIYVERGRFAEFSSEAAA